MSRLMLIAKRFEAFKCNTATAYFTPEDAAWLLAEVTTSKALVRRMNVKEKELHETLDRLRAELSEKTIGDCAERREFAARAMQGLLAHSVDNSIIGDCLGVSKASVKHADALIEELNK